MPELEIVNTDTIRLERTLDAPPETVWRYLVEAELRQLWFAGGTDARAGEPVELVFDHDHLSTEPVPYPDAYAKWKGAVGHEQVVEFDQPNVLAISWDGRAEGVARFELFAQGDGRTRLVLTHSGISGPGPMANFAAGWDSHLAVLAGRLSGSPVANFWALHAKREAEIAKQLGATA